MPKWNQFLLKFSMLLKQMFFEVYSMFKAKCYSCNGGKENDNCKECNGTGFLLYLQGSEIEASKKSNSDKQQT